MPHSDEGQELIDFLAARSSRERRPHRLDSSAYAARDCVYFFTICARQHAEVFSSAELATRVIEALHWRRHRHQWRLFTYCLMPDHLHFLVQLPDFDMPAFDGGSRGLVPEGVQEHVMGFKKYTTTQVWWKLGGRGALWQKSSYDRVIRQGDSIEAAAWYILENPVRKGLVQNWRDHPYSAIVDSWREEDAPDGP